MKLNFITDKPEGNLEKNDLLGTKPYVAALLGVIDKAEAPFTIGLFGGWGSGKSSVIKTIEDKLNGKKDSKTKVFVYDAWKYSKDAFRRTFILNLREAFCLDEGEDYINFYNDEHEEIGHKTVIDKKRAVLGLIYFLPILLFIIWLLYYVLANAVDNIPDISVNTGTNIILGIISVISTIFLFFLKDIYVQYKISITKPKTFAPEQFEDAFVDAIQRITKKIIWIKKALKWFKIGKETIHAETVVIVIDNIDRCHKDLAFELLLTIKNFLEQKNVIFIIPIDETELKKHIKKEGHDGNEFLRKLFNTTLTIKKFSEDDLFDFTKQLQKKYKLDLNDEVLSLISQEFSKNPRKIIQFLNVLQTEIKLAEEQEKEDSNSKSNFRKGVITENIEFLVKILLIREEWTSVYEKLNNNPFILEDINEQIDDGKEDVVYDETENLKLSNEQRRFFESTRDISTENIEVFFANRDSFPGIPDDLPKLVLSQDWKTIKEKYLEKDLINLSSLLDFVDNLFIREVEKKKLLTRSGFNIFSFIFKIGKDNKYGKDLLKTYYNNGKSLSKIRSKLNGKLIGGIILNFNPTLLLDFVRIDLDKNKRLLQTLITTISDEKNDDEKHYALMSEFINKFQDKPEYLKQIGVRFSAMLKEYPEVFDDFKDIFEDPTVSECLIEPNLLEEFIKTLEVTPETGDVGIKVKIIDQYNSSKGLSPKILKQYTTRIIEFLANNNLPILSFWLERIQPLIRSIEDKSLKDSIFEILSQKYTFLWQQYASQWNQPQFQETVVNFLNVANEFYISVKASNTEIEAWLNNFFSKNESSEFALKINNLYQKTMNHFQVFDWPFVTQVVNKFNQLSEWDDKKEIAKTLNLMLSKTTKEKGLSGEEIQKIVKLYIDNIHTDDGVSREWLSRVISSTIIKAQVKEVVKSLNINEKLDILEVVKELDKTLLKECVEEIILNSSSDNLDSIFDRLDDSGVGLASINGGIEKALKVIQKEDNEEYFKKFLFFVAERQLNQTNLIAIVNKISPFLHDEKNKEERVFALQILDKITVPKSKKTLVKELLKDLDTTEFDDVDLKLYERVKRKK